MAEAKRCDCYDGVIFGPRYDVDISDVWACSKCNGGEWMMTITDQELEDRFRYHAPTPEARRRHEEITEASIKFAKVIRDNVPSSRGQSLALTATEEARMWANQGIATNHAALDDAPPSN